MLVLSMLLVGRFALLMFFMHRLVLLVLLVRGLMFMPPPVELGPRSIIFVQGRSIITRWAVSVSRVVTRMPIIPWVAGVPIIDVKITSERMISGYVIVRPRVVITSCSIPRARQAGIIRWLIRSLI